MLLSPGVTQDPRSLTSATNGDLSFGGLRGFQNSFLVDGGDFNNAFFAQARGLYRTPYQFSNDVVQEFRVSTNSYGAELGRAGGAVVNVVTKSGSNHWHGTGLYYIRDSAFGAADAFLDLQAAQPPAARRRHHSAAPSRKTRFSFFGGFDQHYFHVPDVVEFLNGIMEVDSPSRHRTLHPGDYEASDQALVFAAAAQLNSFAGIFPRRTDRQCRLRQARYQSLPAQSARPPLSTPPVIGDRITFSSILPAPLPTIPSPITAKKRSPRILAPPR